MIEKNNLFISKINHGLQLLSKGKITIKEWAHIFMSPFLLN